MSGGSLDKEIIDSLPETQVKNDEGEYIYPRRCEMCGSENICIRVIFNKGITRYVCLDCGNSRSLPKQQNLKKRTNTTLRHWSEQVIKKYPACIICGSQEKLEAHHIIPVSHSSEYMYKPTNGITLCSKCHQLVHKYKTKKEKEDENGCNT